MSHPNNARAREANTALQAFILDTQDDVDVGPTTDDIESSREETGLLYLLADIRHLCDAQGWDFAALDKRAYSVYTEDKNGNPIADVDFAA